MRTCRWWYGNCIAPGRQSSDIVRRSYGEHYNSRLRRVPNVVTRRLSREKHVYNIISYTTTTKWYVYYNNDIRNCCFCQLWLPTHIHTHNTHGRACVLLQIEIILKIRSTQNSAVTQGAVQTVYLSFSEGDRRLSRIPDREFEKNQIPNR